MEIKLTKKADIDFILGITEKDVCKTLIMNLFGEFGNKPARFLPYQYIDVPPGTYGPEGKKNKNTFTTTIGLWIYNRYFIEKDFFDILGYISVPVDGGTVGMINDEASFAILEDRLTIDQLKVYLMKNQHFMSFVSVLSSNYTMKMLHISKQLEPLKRKLIKENKVELDKGNEKVAEEIEKQLLAEAAKLLKGDPSMEIYDSKSRGKWGNNFKNMFIMKGAVMNPDPSKGFDVMTSNYIDGISKEEYHIAANAIPGGAYAKAHDTQIGGYWYKLFLLAFQHVVLGEPGSDCGTKRTLSVALTKKNYKFYLYNYMVKGSKLVELDSKTIKSYIGQTIDIRFSSLCESKDCICNKCMGSLYYRLGNVKNVGMTLTKIPSSIMNWSLKKMHDSSVKLGTMDVEKFFGYDK